MSCAVVFCQVIDEIYRVLRYVNSTRAPQRAHEVLQELRDISSMAMEYFDEKIVPILKKKLPGADLSGRLIGSTPGNKHEFKLEFRREVGPERLLIRQEQYVTTMINPDLAEHIIVEYGMVESFTVRC